MARAAVKVMETAREICTRKSVKVKDVTFEVMEGDPRNVLYEAVEKHHASMLVVGSHCYGAFRRVVLGSEKPKRKHSSQPSSVLQLLEKQKQNTRQPQREDFMTTASEKQVMVVGIDDSEHSMYALEWTLQHFFAAPSSDPPFKLVIVHARPSATSAVGLAGPEVLPIVDSDLKRIAAMVIEKAKELCIRKSWWRVMLEMCCVRAWKSTMLRCWLWGVTVMELLKGTRYDHQHQTNMATSEKQVMVVGIDDSEPSMYALEWTLDHFFAASSSDPLFRLVIVHAKPSATSAVLPVVDSDLKKIAARVIETAKELCTSKSVKDVTFEVAEGDARNVLCEAVERHHASVLVVGSHGYGAIKRAVLGSVSDYCAHHAHCTVMIVKRPKIKH
ncbi:hypothetical protein Tsubulata_029367 [Turnera subulata]|uniref:UspA domain-containing protein n=1 Tax=Turnera subulata TaxID=218843 RepID=A0A9Q0F3G7_9ROSI|nr:hypothetical protein Tsubulata_029367 [Turnera subulata]